jgi:hypothetical protein
MGNPSRVGSTPAVCRSGLHALWLPLVGVGSVTRLDHAPWCISSSEKPTGGVPALASSRGRSPDGMEWDQGAWPWEWMPASARLCPCDSIQQYRSWERVALMKKRNASFYPALEHSALPVLPARSRFLVRPNC